LESWSANPRPHTPAPARTQVSRNPDHNSSLLFSCSTENVQGAVRKGRGVEPMQRNRKYLLQQPLSWKAKTLPCAEARGGLAWPGTPWARLANTCAQL
jgi:hypothetical protein